jgi:uncharacterized membrane protein YeiH
MLSYVVTAIVIGVVTACRGGLLRDVLVSDRAAPVQTRTALRACRFDRSKPVHVAYLVLQNIDYGSSMTGNCLLLCLSHTGHCFRLENSLGVANIT